MLSKDYTLTITRGIIILWLDKLNISGLDPDLVTDFINLGVMDAFSDLQDVIYKDYGRSTTLADSGSAYQATPVALTSFTHSTKTVVFTADQGLTSADIGRRIVVFQFNGTSNVPTKMINTSIVSVSAGDTCVIAHSSGGDLPDISNAAWTSLYPFHSSDSLDLSALRVNRVRKLVDSISGECVEAKDARDFDNLSRFPQKQNKIYWYQNGETLQLYKGSNVAAYGTLTLHYFGKPIAVSADGDYLDLKDEHVPLAIRKTQDYCLAHINRTGQLIPGLQQVQMKKNTEQTEELKDKAGK